MRNVISDLLFIWAVLLHSTKGSEQSSNRLLGSSSEASISSKGSFVKAIFNTTRLVESIAKSRVRWRAGAPTFFMHKTREQLKNSLGSHLPANLTIPSDLKIFESNTTYNVRIDSATRSDWKNIRSFAQSNGTYPTYNPPPTLDLREKYKNCLSISLVRDQSNCGSCWALAATSTVSDRFCIKYNVDRSFSTQDLMECCVGCHFNKKRPCEGGYVHLALYYLKNVGAASGELFGDNSTCKPYFKAPKATDFSPGPSVCTRNCVDNKKYPVPYLNDKFRLKNYVNIQGEKNMEQELVSGGSIIATFDLYEDFYVYKSGIYEHISGELLDVHSVRVIGFGKADGIEYWICANSWGTDWGENGFFRIRKGVNESNFERYWTFVPLF